MEDEIASRLEQVSLHSLLHIEAERLKTFEHDEEKTPSPKILALTGMYYLGPRGRVKCYFCRVEIDRWQEIEDPVGEHLKWSPRCPLLLRRQTENVPTDEDTLNEALPPLSIDVCGNPLSGQKYPEYASELVRVRSFRQWALDYPDVFKLAEAGFFYTGLNDSVYCFCCGGGLKDWDPSDDPWEQHALWLRGCPFVKRSRGEDFIAEMVEKQALGMPKSNNADATVGSTTTSGLVANDYDDGGLCKICLQVKYDTVFIPCGHIVACTKCAMSVDACPLCRKPYTKIIRVYFS